MAKTNATWPIECDSKMLEMLQFCISTMGQLISEDIKNGGGCGCGAEWRTVSQLRSDKKTANNILAAAAKAEINLGLQKHVAKKVARKKAGK